jgi:hypothetical protein
VTSMAAYVALFVTEVAYILAFYNPADTRMQAGLMLIFAAEVSVLYRIAASNLEEKKRFKKISGTSRFYTALASVPVLGEMSLAIGWLDLGRYPIFWIGLFLLSVGGKIAWKRNNARLLAQPA